MTGSRCYLMHSDCYGQSGRSRLKGTFCGFTMVEILIVAVVIAIAAVMIVPLVSSAAGMQIRSAANMIAADLEYTKSMAISTQQVYSMVFDESADSYQIEDPNGVIDHPVKKGFKYIVSFSTDGRLDKVDITGVNFDSTLCVKFDYLGSPYNCNGAPLGSGVVTLQAAETTATVTVEPVTGFISIGQ